MSVQWKVIQASHIHQLDFVVTTEWFSGDIFTKFSHKRLTLYFQSGLFGCLFCLFYIFSVKICMLKKDNSNQWRHAFNLCLYPNNKNWPPYSTMPNTNHWFVPEMNIWLHMFTTCVLSICLVLYGNKICLKYEYMTIYSIEISINFDI